MEITFADGLVFATFVIAVVAIGLIKSRHEADSESYFLAGRGLSWWLIGFSLIAANISTEQFVGMSGQAADYVGLAIASYEWMAAITLVVCAFFFLPKFLRAGIYTIPEFLEYRFNRAARSMMAVFTMVVYVGVTIAAVIYSGALMVNTLFPDVSVTAGAWAIGVLAAIYVASGGLKACAWADLIQGSALIVGGAVILWLAIDALAAAPVAALATTADVQGLADSAGGWDKFFALNADKLHMVLPADDMTLPWTALVVGLWIPNFYYWGLNQYITQRTLGSHSLAHGQRGVVFAAALKLVIPFVIVFPGMIAFDLYSGEMAAAVAADGQIQATNTELLEEFEAAVAAPTAPGSQVVFEFDAAWARSNPEKSVEIAAWNERVLASTEVAGIEPVKEHLTGYKYDTAFGLLVGRLVPGGSGLRGFILAAILGAVISSLASMLNAASTIFTMDLFREYLRPGASQRALVMTGRLCVGVFTVIGCSIAPLLGDPEFGGIFTFIQEFQGFISPGILAVFVFGLFVRRAPSMCGVVGLVANPLIYWGLMFLLPDFAFLDRMAVSFGCVLGLMGLLTLWQPRLEALPERPTPPIDLQSCPLARATGVLVVIATLILYGIFW
ncbi:MAG: sodium/solute symporter [Planctomycetes bacterium]|nr:sodium/solute symporter [Planctomycetota bacterium]